MRAIVSAAMIAGLGYALGAFAQVPDIDHMDVVERSVPAGPVAIIGGTAIEGKEFLADYRRHLTNVMAMVGDSELNDEFRVRAGLTILGDMIRTEILLKEAERRNLTVPNAEVEAEFQKKMEYFSKQLSKDGTSSPTEAQVLERAGQSREEAMDSIRRQLLAAKMAEVVAKEDGVQVTSKEAKTYYDENPQLFQVPGQMHLNQILAVPKPNAASANEKAWAAAEEKVGKARARILAGEQFAAVARDMSEAPDAAKGGDMNMNPVSALPPFFVNHASQLKPGELSTVFRSEYGVHLIRLVEVEAASNVSFNEAEDRIKMVLSRAGIEEAIQKFCDPMIRDEEYTKVFIQLERTLASLGTE
ncbi:MAG: peptidylprolyl isomerase [Candidatus Hydrogenedentales bacterium]